MRKIIFSSLVVVLVLCGVQAMAQPTGGGPGGGNGPCPTPPCNVPIDGGIAILAAAGAALGIKKLKGNNKKGE